MGGISPPSMAWLPWDGLSSSLGSPWRHCPVCDHWVPRAPGRARLGAGGLQSFLAGRELGMLVLTVAEHEPRCSQAAKKANDT